jgi:predicted CXXCH cytochrome family protein
MSVPGSLRRKLVMGGVAVSAVLILLSCTTLKYTVAPPPSIAGATFVGNQACYDCHTNITRSFPSSAHARLHVEGARMSGQVGCESCHGPGSLHVQSGGGRGVFIVNPGRDSQACVQCHFEVHAQFSLPQHHPLPEGRMHCVQCHDPHGLDILKPAGGLAMARRNEACASCHRDQARPFVFVHEALREGCVSCHEPHGSVHAKMLVNRDNNLCLRCHAQVASPSALVLPNSLAIGKVFHAGGFIPGANNRVMQGSCWSSGCHTAVHGSNVDPRLRF